MCIGQHFSFVNKFPTVTNLYSRGQGGGGAKVVDDFWGGGGGGGLNFRLSKITVGTVSSKFMSHIV